MGWNRSEGMLLHDSSVNKFDDAGNSLMVDSYKNNRYCRVSCSENWQLSMEAFGNFVGDRAIAAGSYFAVNDTDMFVSGKRTCYTTFINYGNTNEGSEIGAGDQGFTKDLSDESDNIANMYNRYSNLSHVYADLACENDGEYHTEGGHDVKCSYSNIFAWGYKFCYWANHFHYCLTGEGSDSGRAGMGSDGGYTCRFKIDAWHEKYCPSGYSMSSDEATCSTSFKATVTNGHDWTDTKDKNADGTCPTGYDWELKPGDEEGKEKCYKATSSSDCGNPDSEEGDVSGPSWGWCTKTIASKDYYSCTTKHDGTTHLDEWEPNYALGTAMEEMRFDYYADHISAARNSIPGVEFDETNEPDYRHMCNYKYPAL